MPKSNVKALLGDEVKMRCRALRRPMPETEFLFANFPPIKRLWRFDYAWPVTLRYPDQRQKIAIEFQGGVYSHPVKCHKCGSVVMKQNKASGRWQKVMEAIGKHTRMKGYENDCEKLNMAMKLGWRVFWITSDMVKNGHLTRIIEENLPVIGGTE